MKHWFTLIAGASALLVPALALAASPFEGRWDMTITTQRDTYPGWLEVKTENGQMHVRVQPRAGSVHPAAAVATEGSHLLVTLNKADNGRPAMIWDLTADGDHLNGSLKRGDTDAGKVEGARAPALNHKPPKHWTTPEALFNGKDLDGWKPERPDLSHWVAKDGVLLNETKGSNLIGTRKFEDFKIHLEYNCPAGGNSGFYLRGRYEVQIEYEPGDTEDPYHRMGAIYGFIPPAKDVPRKAGEWESFDITLVGRDLTIVRDGIMIIDHQQIPGITGGALDSHEGEPGPFYIQGDHTGGMKFRNITISVPK